MKIILDLESEKKVSNLSLYVSDLLLEEIAYINLVSFHKPKSNFL